MRSGDKLQKVEARIAELEAALATTEQNMDAVRIKLVQVSGWIIHVHNICNVLRLFNLDSRLRRARTTSNDGKTNSATSASEKKAFAHN